MLSILTLLTIVTLSLVVTRIATVALAQTGLSKESARFQARSALTGAGFTTTESETVVNHPVRRKVVLMLMLLGNAGIVSVIASLILSFAGVHDNSSLWQKLLLLFGGMGALWLVARSAYLDQQFSKLIGWALKRYTNLNVKDYASLLHISKDYNLAELIVHAEDWIAGRALQETKLRDEGVVVIGIHQKSGAYIGAPQGETVVEAGDTLILYGKMDRIDTLDTRQKDQQGDEEHEEIVEEAQKTDKTGTGS